MDNTYCYPGTDILKNKFNIKDQSLLDAKERLSTGFRLAQLELKPIEGNFDLNHLQKIHKHIFQDVYNWAGNMRVVDISKGNTPFAYNQFIKEQSEVLFRKLRKEDNLINYDIDKFSDRLAYYAGEINIIHPFREGNGRSTREFIRSLADNAGFKINYSEISKERLMNAFIRSVANHTDLKNLFKDHIIEGIKNAYINEIPGIKHASEKTLYDINKIRELSPDNEFMTFKQLKQLQKDLSKKVDAGEIGENDSDFRRVVGVNTELTRLKTMHKEIGTKTVEMVKRIDLEM